MLMLPASAAGEVFFANIVSASFLSDFAFSSFPVSFWGEFGVRNLDLLPNRDSRAVVRVEAGLDQRAIRQYPVSGAVIKDHVVGSDEEYVVIFSDGSIGFEQGLLDNPEPSHPDFLTVGIYLGMRWEQAIPSIGDIQEGNYEGVFGNEEYFPSSANGNFPGLPELSGNRYSLTNYITLSVSMQNKIADILTPDGFVFNASFTYAPWWLANSLPLFQTTIDFFRMVYAVSYSYTFLQEMQPWEPAKSLYTFFMDFRFNCQLLFGDAIPQHASIIYFRGNAVAPRLFYADARLDLTFTGPEILWDGTFPSIVFFLENAVSAGGFINNDAKENPVGFYGTLGMRLKIDIIGLFSAYVGFYYDYLPPEGYASKVGLDLGFTFSAMF